MTYVAFPIGLVMHWHIFVLSNTLMKKLALKADIRFASCSNSRFLVKMFGMLMKLTTSWIPLDCNCIEHLDTKAIYCSLRGWSYKRCCNQRTVHMIWRVIAITILDPCSACLTDWSHICVFAFGWQNALFLVIRFVQEKCMTMGRYKSFPIEWQLWNISYTSSPMRAWTMLIFCRFLATRSFSKKYLLA